MTAASYERQLGTIKIEDDTLCCGICGGSYLHHSYVVVFHRNEDAPRTLEIRVDGGSAKQKIMPSAKSGNPSDRRGGIAIGFYCENCEGHGELAIAQHKGQSLVAWRHGADDGAA